jgi:hypothetical protein
MVVVTKTKETVLEHCPGSDKGAGEDTPSKPKSSGGNDEEEDEHGEEGEVTPPL